MTQSFLGRRGMAVAPHSLAAESAVAVLREGGNAIEAMIAAAATIAVVYPHMNSIGGDAFWVMRGPNGVAGGIDASGPSAAAASLSAYQARGIRGAIPFRGGDAALTVAGTVGGWGLAHRVAASVGGRLPLSRLLSDAIWYADQGIPVTASQSLSTAEKLDELRDLTGFSQTFLIDGAPPAIGELFRQPRLAASLRRIAMHGTQDFYRGELARSNALELEALGSPLRFDDLAAYEARLVNPLLTSVRGATLRNMQPPSQGVVSMMILGIMDRVLRRYPKAIGGPTSPSFVHLQVEATKLAFKVRDQHLTDPAFMTISAQALLDDQRLEGLAAEVRLDRAAPWGARSDPADTVWMGVIDESGMAISFIQSIYHEFGSGLVLPTSGVNWQNRGCGFSLDPAHINRLEPRKRPFHTLNAGLAELDDGTTMVYGTMGGDGQPQTQATVFTRIHHFGQAPQDAIEAPRWLLGRTWGNASDTLKLESRFPPDLVAALGDMGHDVEVIGAWDEAVGHAGAILRRPNGVFLGGFDPRSNGAVCAL